MSSNISFAQNLQSEAGQKAIMFRLESELRILEVLKKFLTVQVRLEKEHSSAIGNATSTAMKAIHSILTDSPGAIETGALIQKNKKSSSTESNNESVISRETVHVLEEIQVTFTTTKRNAAFLEANTLTELNELISQKRILLKSAQEEYGRIKANLDQLTDSIGKLKAEYFKSFNCYESARTKFENTSCAKVPGSSENSKKSGELRNKFFRMKGRLNLSHAEYLLIIQEARIYDRDFRTILLPSLLQIEQTWCEKQLTQWSQLLDDILNNCSGISQTARLKLKDFEFGKEYTQLLSRHKTPPLPSMDFKFEPARLSSQPVAQGSIIVDSSTITFLKRKLSEVEKRLKEAEIQLVDKQTGKNKYKGHALVEDLKSFDTLVTKCDIDRLKHLKSYYEAHLSGFSSPTKLDTVSLISEQSLRKRNRFSSFLRTAATLTLTKKSISLDEESQSDSIKGNSSNTSSATKVINGIVMARDMVKGLSEEIWFHGVLPREDVIRLLKLEGDYLVRETVKNGEQQLVLSVLWNGNKHFMVQKTLDAQFQFEGPIFKSVRELLEHYVKTKNPITNRSGAIIVRPVKREKWELNNDDVELIEKIGKGNFGDVYKAIVNGTLVAVKTCKVDLPEDQKRKFLREARILKQYNHPNIVQFIGICAQKQPIMIAMELVPGGSLLTYLKGKGKLLSAKVLTKMCLDTAAGMKYLEERNCLHRDLAARNCLIDETSSSVKISDFGMSREEHEYTISDGLKQIPIKWTAPEALNYGKYTTLSDCWSFGILMWEIFGYGSTPYPGMTNSKAREMIEAGYRMPGPENVPDVIYQLMTRCWQYEPEQRPRFSEIHSELEVISNSDLI